MNWKLLEDAYLEDALIRGRGRPWPRLARGLLIVIIAIVVMSVVIFVLFLLAPPNAARLP